MKEQLLYLCNDLKFNNNVLDIGFELLNRLKHKNITLSKTGNDEILIYSEKEGRFYNLLLDEDGDISFLLIGVHMKETKTEFFSSEKPIDYDYICSLI